MRETEAGSKKRWTGGDREQAGGCGHWSGGELWDVLILEPTPKARGPNYYKQTKIYC